MAGRGQSPGRGRNIDSEEWVKIKTCRRFQELFHGRFTNPQTGFLLKHNGWDLGEAVGFTLSKEPEAITEMLKLANVDGEDFGVDVTRRQRREAILKNDHVQQLAKQDKVNHEVRQFACEEDDNMWWRRVPSRKPVSRCMKCRKSFDAIPPDVEWGWAEFNCPCGNTFHGFGAMGKTKCPCFTCKQICEPEKILPPFKRNRREGLAGKGRHKCTAPNCFNRCLLRCNEPEINMCVHPKSLPKSVIEASREHLSTGSTVKTFLTQADLPEPYNDYEPSLADIQEYVGHS